MSNHFRLRSRNKAASFQRLWQELRKDMSSNTILQSRPNCNEITLESLPRTTNLIINQGRNKAHGSPQKYKILRLVLRNRKRNHSDELIPIASLDSLHAFLGRANTDGYDAGKMFP